MVQMINSFASKPKGFFVEVINQSTFNSYFTISYNYNNFKFNFTSEILEKTDLEKIMIANKATNIVVTIYVVNQAGQNNLLYTKTFATATTLKMLLTGTEIAPVYTDITNPLANHPPINYYVSVVNTASFVGKLFVKYTLNNRIFNDSSDSISDNHTVTLRIPSSATNIQVTVQIKDETNPWATIYTNTLPSAAILKLSLSGTITSPVCTDITSQDVSSNLTTLAEGAISVSNNGEFISQFMITYNLTNYSVYVASDNLLKGQTTSIPIPEDATNVILEIDLLNTDNSWFSIYENNYSEVPTIALNLTGTITSPVVTDVTPNPPLGGEPGFPLMNLTKDTDKTLVNIGDIVTFIINVSNMSGGDATDVVLTDNISNGTSFIPSSLTLDGANISGNTFLSNGIALGDMFIGDSHTITYSIRVNILPYPNPVENDPVINYDYIDNTGATQIGTLTGTTTPFKVIPNAGNGNGMPTMKLTKTPDQTMYMVGDVVTFTVVVQNLSGGDANNIILTDNIPNEASFVISSLTLDNNTIEGSTFLANGILIPNMSVGDSHIVKYQIIINSMPNPNPVENDPVINYDYLNNTGATQIGTLTGTTVPFTVVTNGSSCCCCCCCPCQCTPQDTYNQSYIDYLKSLGYL